MKQQKTVIQMEEKLIIWFYEKKNTKINSRKNNSGMQGTVVDWARAALPNMVVIRHMWLLFKIK